MPCVPLRQWRELARSSPSLPRGRQHLRDPGGQGRALPSRASPLPCAPAAVGASSRPGERAGFARTDTQDRGRRGLDAGKAGESYRLRAPDGRTESAAGAHRCPPGQKAHLPAGVRERRKIRGNTFLPLVCLSRSKQRAAGREGRGGQLASAQLSSRLRPFGETKKTLDICTQTYTPPNIGPSLLPPRPGSALSVVCNSPSSRLSPSAASCLHSPGAKDINCRLRVLSRSDPGTMPSTGTAGPKVHRLHCILDPEALGVVTVLLGIFQLLLAIPVYYTDLQPPRVLITPVLIGVLFIIAGSFSIACEKSPSRQLLRGCLYSNGAGLLVALCAVFVYSVSLHQIPKAESCESHGPDVTICQLTAAFRGMTIGVAALLMIYDIAALVLQSVLAFCALRELK
ncbi:uncharacterized protein [Lepisosteus oculatus]|uniref:uncharacterized protein n=1 Tax=Lepisosteus oculatus TaxID=7918 RepID=UPI003717A215